MHVESSALDIFTRTIQPSNYLRCTPLAFGHTPLGMGFGKTRFASPKDAFKLIYIGADLRTSIAEAIVRDRFELGDPRELMESEVLGWGACAVTATSKLTVLDLRPDDSCFQLGISTDVTGAKAQEEAREFSQHLYNSTDLDGILYKSRLVGGDCVAIYDRSVVTKLTSTSVEDLISLAELVPSLKHLRIDLIADLPAA